MNNVRNHVTSDFGAKNAKIAVRNVHHIFNVHRLLDQAYYNVGDFWAVSRESLMKSGWLKKLNYG